MRHRATVFAVVVGLALTAAFIAGPAQAAECSLADSSPTAVGRSAAARSTLCLLNQERAAHGLRGLRLDSKLSRAARRHTADMVARHYFDHVSPSGSTLTTRIRATGWMRSRRSWTIAENIAEGTGGLASPRAVVSGWMHSPAHRAQILTAEFRMIGIGIAPRTTSGEAGATYTTDFGG
jgi:uncharacterized protein YkwD